MLHLLLRRLRRQLLLQCLRLPRLQRTPVLRLEKRADDGHLEARNFRNRAVRRQGCCLLRHLRDRQPPLVERGQRSVRRCLLLEVALRNTSHTNGWAKREKGGE